MAPLETLQAPSFPQMAGLISAAEMMLKAPDLRGVFCRDLSRLRVGSAVVFFLLFQMVSEEMPTELFGLKVRREYLKRRPKSRIFTDIPGWDMDVCLDFQPLWSMKMLGSLGLEGTKALENPTFQHQTGNSWVQLGAPFECHGPLASLAAIWPQGLWWRR